MVHSQGNKAVAGCIPFDTFCLRSQFVADFFYGFCERDVHVKQFNRPLSQREILSFQDCDSHFSVMCFVTPVPTTRTARSDIRVVVFVILCMCVRLHFFLVAAVWQSAHSKEGTDDQHFRCAFSQDARGWTASVSMSGMRELAGYSSRTPLRRTLWCRRLLVFRNTDIAFLTCRIV